ncbi:GntR family transcriptional regulator [Cognatishimia sp. WU-CL00825]|uniref:GntR family transcriptional regulator n=1 Tax=Cognatishimia sp. WU-CL00825 TaxID=3127658 RepID=UPI0031045A94
MKEEARRRKADLFEHLKVSILTQQLLPGSDLDEAELSAAFGLSRTPLREVFREMSGAGYLELRANKGARVSDLSYRTLRDFFLAAPMIYGAILRLAALNASNSQLNELKEAQQKFKAALRIGSAGDRALANNHFHEVTGDMAGNIFLQPSFQRLLIDHARIGTTFYQPQNTEMVSNLAKASDQHDQIISAIETRNEQLAGTLADEHWNLSRGQIEVFVMPEALEVPLGTLSKSTSA